MTVSDIRDAFEAYHRLVDAAEDVLAHDYVDYDEIEVQDIKLVGLTMLFEFRGRTSYEIAWEYKTDCMLMSEFVEKVEHLKTEHNYTEYKYKATVADVERIRKESADEWKGGMNE